MTTPPPTAFLVYALGVAAPALISFVDDVLEINCLGDIAGGLPGLAWAEVTTRSKPALAWHPFLRPALLPRYKRILKYAMGEERWVVAVAKARALAPMGMEPHMLFASACRIMAALGKLLSPVVILCRSYAVSNAVK